MYGGRDLRTSFCLSRESVTQHGKRRGAMSGKRAADRQINNNMTEEELEGGSEEPVGTWQKADEVRARTHAK